MIKTLQNTLKQDKERFTVPKSVQDIIPIRRIWPDGVFQFGSKYSKTLRFSDINYAIASQWESMWFRREEASWTERSKNARASSTFFLWTDRVM